MGSDVKGLVPHNFPISWDQRRAVKFAQDENPAGRPGCSLDCGSASTQLQIALNARSNQLCLKSVDLSRVCPNVQNESGCQQLQTREKQGLDTPTFLLLGHVYCAIDSDSSSRKDLGEHGLKPAIT